MRQLVLVAMIAGVTGCAHQAYVFAPAHVSGTAAVEPVAQGGDVRIAVVGEDQLVERRYLGTSARALHVRVAFDNRSTASWIVDPSQQLARIDRYGVTFPAAASAVPVVIPPGETRTLDLFYPIPRPQYGPTEPARLTLDWKLRTVDGVVAERTAFDRRAVSAEVAAAQRTRL